jgi:hypothetical protein
VEGESRYWNRMDRGTESGLSTYDEREVTMQTPNTEDGISAFVVPSMNITASAIRLILAGFLAKLEYEEHENGILSVMIPSETRREVIYCLDYNCVTQTLKCPCPAGVNGKPCKPFRLFQLAHGFAIAEVAS